MSAMLPPRPYTSLKVPQMFPSQKEECSSAITGQMLQKPKVVITGELNMYVTESEAALYPILGSYSVETSGMQELLHILWHTEGQVIQRKARSVDIAFDLRGTQTGQTHTYLVAVQIVERGTRGRVVQSGVFVHIFVTSDDL